MTARWNTDKPSDPLPTSNPAYLRSNFPLPTCMKAEAEVSMILRDLGERRVTANQVLIAMLPVLNAQNSITFTEREVRAAIDKILSCE